jgi:hypothetical protein
MKKIKNIKKIYLIIACVVLVGVIIFAFKKSSGDSYREYTVTYSDVSDELLLAGTIDARKRVNLGFAAGGRVAKNNVEVGDFVKKGDVLAEISQNRLQSDLLQAQASYTVTRVDAESDVDGVTDTYEKRLNEQNVLVDGLYQQYLSGDLAAYRLDDGNRDATAPVISGTYNGTQQGDYIIDVYSSSSYSGYSFRVSGLASGTYTAEIYQPGKLGDNGLYIQFDDDSNYSNTTWIVSLPIRTRSSSSCISISI